MLKPEEIQRERRFIEAEKRRIERSRPLTRAEKERMRAREEILARQSMLVEEIEEASEELPYEPSEEDVEAFKGALERVRHLVQERYVGPAPSQVSDVIENEAKTVCLRRPTRYIVQDPETKEKIRSEERLSPPHCRTIPAVEMECIEKKEDAESCELVKQAYACANDLSVAQVASVTDLDREEVRGCVEDLERERTLVEDSEILGEPKYTMPRPIVRKVLEEEE